MREIAPEFGISDVGLAKLCKRSKIPFPHRGYWAKKRAGKPVDQPALPEAPPRSDGVLRLSDSIAKAIKGEAKPVRAEPDYGLGPEPEFPNDAKQRLAECRELVGAVKVRPLGSKLHSEVARVLAEDERRHATKPSPYSYSSVTTYFDNRLGQRRLRLLNSVFLALESYGAVVTIRDEWARECVAKFDGAGVHFSLDTRTTVADGRTQETLTFRLRGDPPRSEVRKSWNELKQRLDEQLSEVVVGLLVAAEDNRREGVRARHRQLVAAETERIREEARRRERERQAAIEKLEKDASKFRLASDIRALSAAARLADPTSPAVAEWCEWALGHAASIDPVANGSVFERPDPDSYRFSASRPW
jgi:hypothetical protein